MTTNITDDEEGKPVVTTDDDQIGVVATVEHGTAYVEPDPGLTDELKAKVGFGDTDEDTYPLQEERIETITEEEIVLHDDR